MNSFRRWSHGGHVSIFFRSWFRCFSSWWWWWRCYYFTHSWPLPLKYFRDRPLLLNGICFSFLAFFSPFRVELGWVRLVFILRIGHSRKTGEHSDTLKKNTFFLSMQGFFSLPLFFLFFSFYIYIRLYVYVFTLLFFSFFKQEADAGKDGRVDWQEFLGVMRGCPPAVQLVEEQKVRQTHSFAHNSCLPTP